MNLLVQKTENKLHYPWKSKPTPLSRDTRNLLAKRFDAYHAIEFIQKATNGEAYLFGGLLRRAFIGQSFSGDIDIMIPNGDERAILALDSLDVQFTLNSQGHRRYRWNKLEIDIFQPRNFFSGHQNVESALCAFDLKINALALHLGSDLILDPFDITASKELSDPRINWSCWEDKPIYQTMVLAIRLVKIMHETPELIVPQKDAEKISKEVIPIIQKHSWDQVQERFPWVKMNF